MTSLILYESRNGYTLECANILSKGLGNIEVKNIKEEYDLDGVDCILIGSPIYNGELEQDTIDFLMNNKWKLVDKKLGVFCSGMNTKEFNLAVQNSIPVDLFMHAEIVHCGGIINYESLSWKEKRIVKRRLGIKKNEVLDYKYKLDDLITWVKNK